ncbi:MAG: c-type cytochrome [Myxococcota bacterium]|nr:c-type cytochrome [Myxococcota bacterium]
MKRAFVLLVLGGVIVWGTPYCGGSVPSPTLLTEPFPPNPRGAQLYEKYCALCHGKNGEGYIADEATALASQDFLTAVSDEYIAANTLRGRPGTPMSAWGRAFGGALTDQDAADLVAHLRTWQTEAPIDLSGIEVSGQAIDGAEPYAIHCETCHGSKGQGGSAMTLNNPVFKETASDGMIWFTIERGRRQTKMKGFGDKLSSSEIDDVVAFVKEMPPAPAFSDLKANIQAAGPSTAAESLVLNPGNPLAQFNLKDKRYVAAEEVHIAYQNKQSFVIIDARPYSDYLISHIEGAVSMPFYDVEKRLGELSKDIWIITYCGCPHAISGQALDVLRANGYEKSGVLDEGFYVWSERGYPVVGP